MKRAWRQLPFGKGVNRHQAVVIAGGNHRLRECLVIDLCTYTERGGRFILSTFRVSTVRNS